MSHRRLTLISTLVLIATSSSTVATATWPETPLLAERRPQPQAIYVGSVPNQPPVPYHSIQLPTVPTMRSPRPMVLCRHTMIIKGEVVRGMVSGLPRGMCERNST